MLKFKETHDYQQQARPEPDTLAVKTLAED